MPPASYTSTLAETLAPDVLERFLRYVRIDTQSAYDRTGSPSTAGQLDLGRLLVDELLAAGLQDAQLDANGYVTATLEASEPGAPVIGVLAHMDTSPDAPGAGVTPIVHRAYDGGVIALPRLGTRLDPDTMTELRDKHGHDIVTSSGDTLLGADDKAGVAEVMAAVCHLAAHPELPRPELRVGFTPDEEIGEGATLFDIDAFGAVCAYTMDGSDIGELQDETFSAVEVRVDVEGVDVHPGQATGKLVNAMRLVARILAALPADRLTPETTSGLRGFHPPGPVDRDCRTGRVPGDRPRLRRRQAAGARRVAAQGVARTSSAPSPVPVCSFDVRRQYRNMRAYLDPVPHVVDAAERAIRAEGLEPMRTPIRGGTDGSRLSERGLPTPNIFTGGHEYHSVREWASVHDMASAAAVIIRLAAEWAAPEMRDGAHADAGAAAG